MFKRFIIVTSLLSLLCLPAIKSFADVLTVRKGAPERYVVKKGDTLWDLSAIYLTQPWLWPKLWRLNPQIKNPHLIYPGDVISLSYDADGVPILSVNSKVIKLSPKKRITSKQKTAIPTLPLRLIRPYLSYEQSLDDAHLNSLPYVLGADDNNKNWITGQTLYVNSPLSPDITYALYRKGQAYTNIGSRKVIGYQTTLVGTAKVIRPGSAQGEPAAIQLTSYAEVKAGDKVLPANIGQTLPVHFNITKPDVPLDATIIASPQQYRQYSKFDVVVLNVGLSQQAKVGNMLDIYHQSPRVLDMNKKPGYYEDAPRFKKFAGWMTNKINENSQVLRNMPKEKVGQLMIFKVYQNISYALITGTTKPVRKGDTTFEALETQQTLLRQEQEQQQDATKENEDLSNWFGGE
ncbi:MAG: hypothetical protein ACI8WB_003278 [Phenylobacterium sp.]|jgi:hypothetical protein